MPGGSTTLRSRIAPDDSRRPISSCTGAWAPAMAATANTSWRAGSITGVDVIPSVGVMSPHGRVDDCTGAPRGSTSGSCRCGRSACRRCRSRWRPRRSDRRPGARRRAGRPRPERPRPAGRGRAGSGRPRRGRRGRGGTPSSSVHRCSHPPGLGRAEQPGPEDQCQDQGRKHDPRAGAAVGHRLILAVGAAISGCRGDRGRCTVNVNGNLPLGHHHVIAL